MNWILGLFELHNTFSAKLMIILAFFTYVLFSFLEHRQDMINAEILNTFFKSQACDNERVVPYTTATVLNKRTLITNEPQIRHILFKYDKDQDDDLVMTADNAIKTLEK